MTKEEFFEKYKNIGNVLWLNFNKKRERNKSLGIMSCKENFTPQRIFEEFNIYFKAVDYIPLSAATSEMLNELSIGNLESAGLI